MTRYRKNDPRDTPEINQDVIEYILKYTAISDDCWIWTGGQNHGYGRAEIGGRRYLAHRVSYAAFNGPIPEGLFIMHSCDTPLCVRPDHLAPATHEENMRDKIAKGRQRGASYAKVGGERGSRAKLTNYQAEEIRRLVTGGATQTSLAARFGVHISTISDIVHYETYADRYRLSREPQAHKIVNYRNKLTFEQASEIRKLYSGGNVTQPELATRFGVDVTTISSVTRNIVYRDQTYVPPKTMELKFNESKCAEIKLLYESSDLSKAAIAKRFLISATTIAKIVGPESRPWKLKQPHMAAKLTVEQANEIRSMYATGDYSQSALALKFKIHQVTVSDILLNRTYKTDTSTPITLAHKRGKPAAKLSAEQVDKIRSLYAAKSHGQYELARMFGVSQQGISEIIRGASYFKFSP